jgi:hypothetical protein
VNDDNIPSAETARRDAADRPSTAVATFVARAITEQRRNDAFSRLLADMLATRDDSAEVERELARETLAVS